MQIHVQGTVPLSPHCPLGRPLGLPGCPRVQLPQGAYCSAWTWAQDGPVLPELADCKLANVCLRSRSRRRSKIIGPGKHTRHSTCAPWAAGSLGVVALLSAGAARGCFRGGCSGCGKLGVASSASSAGRRLMRNLVTPAVAMRDRRTLGSRILRMATAGGTKFRIKRRPAELAELATTHPEQPPRKQPRETPAESSATAPSEPAAHGAQVEWRVCFPGPIIFDRRLDRERRQTLSNLQSANMPSGRTGPS